MTNGENWTQYYEYDNDYDTHVSENVEILSQADWTGYFQVVAYDGTPIKDATIRAEASYPLQNNGSWVNHTLIGQRLTDLEGYTFFIFDSRTEVLLTVMKDGYAPVEVLMTVGDEEWDGTKSTATQIQMLESDEGVYDTAWISVPRTVKNKSEDISGI